MSAARDLRRRRNRTPAYMVKALRAFELGLIPRGCLTHACIYHDEWCSFLNGTGDCDCDPDVEYRPVPWPEDKGGADAQA